MPKNQNINQENTEIAIREDAMAAQQNAVDIHSVVNNQLRQAPNLFQNATFSNCNFNFTLPK